MSYTVRVRDTKNNKDYSLNEWPSPFLPAKGDLIELTVFSWTIHGRVKEFGYSVTDGFTPANDRYPDNSWTEIEVVIYIE